MAGHRPPHPGERTRAPASHEITVTGSGIGSLYVKRRRWIARRRRRSARAGMGKAKGRNALLDVVGAGFGRTGTLSLKLALERLGFGPCHHMMETIDNPDSISAWRLAAQGEPVDWDEMYDGYRSTVDWPGARFWRELTARYPSAK